MQASNGGALRLEVSSDYGFDNEGNLQTNGGDVEIVLPNSSGSNDLYNGGLILAGSGNTLTLTLAGGVGSIINDGGIGVDGNLVLKGSGSVDITGNGALTLGYSGGTGAQVYGSGGSQVALYNGFGHTIQGVGTIHDLSFVNHGLVDANGGDTLEIQVGGGSAGLHNFSDGTLQASNGTLTLTVTGSQPIINDGTIQTAGGNVIMQVTNGVPITNGQLNMLNNTASGTINVQAFDNLTVNGTGSNIFIPVNMHNDGLIQVAGGATLTFDGAGGAFNLNGNGSLVLSGGLVTGTDGSQTLQNAAGHTISGWGAIQNLTLENDGMVNANASGQTLAISTLPNSSNWIWNHTGTMQASGGGTLEVDLGDVTFSNSGTIQTAGGDLVIDTSSSTGGTQIQNYGSIGVSGSNNLTVKGRNWIEFVNEGTINVGAGSSLVLQDTGGGPGLRLDLVSSGGGTLTLAGGTITGALGTETLYNDFYIGLPVGHTIQGYGAITNLGLLVNAGASIITSNVAGQNLTIQPAAGGAFVNAGLLQATNGGSLTLDLSAGGQFQNNDRHFVPNTFGVVSIDNGSTMTIMGNSGGYTEILNNGVINVNSGGELALDGGGGGGATFKFTYDPPAGTTGSTGAITLAGGKILGLNDNEMLINGAGHTIQGSGLITGLGVVNEDPAVGGPNGMIIANGGPGTELQFHPNSLGFDNHGTLRAEAGSTLVVDPGPGLFYSYGDGTMLYGRYEAAGIIQLPIGDIINNGAEIVLSGTGDIQKTTGDSALTQFADNRGLFQLTDDADFTTLSTQFTNEGQLIIEPGSSFTVDLGEYIQTGGTTNVNGTLNAASVDIQGGTLEGGGTLDASVTNGGVFSPGNSIATVYIHGDYIQLATGELDMEIGLVNNLPANDELIIDDTATLHGLLDIIMLGGYEPNIGMSFELMTYGAWSGTFFDSLNLPSWNDRHFQLTYGPGDLKLLTVGNQQGSVPEPVTCLSIGGGLIAMALAYRKRRSKPTAF